MTDTNALKAETNKSVGNPEVIVGVDGSEGAQRALAWAVNKQDSLGPVTPIMTYHIPPFGDGLGTPGAYADVATLLQEDAEQQMANVLAGQDQEIRERGRIIRGYPGTALVNAAGDAALLVVGSRGRSALAETLLGSVGSHCANHSTVPVAVIPEPTVTDKDLERVVVGLDGSENAERALRWAVDHVHPAGRVTAIGCWRSPMATDALAVSRAALEADIRAKVTSTLDRVLGGTAQSPTVETSIEYGDPRLVLREAAMAADLLVVGSRGHRGIPHLLLGSVTTSLLHHPASATVVVPG